MAMKLASLRDGTRDGKLAIASRDLARLAPAADLAPTLQAALDRWEDVEPALARRAAALEAGELAGTRLDPTRLGPPLPRAYEWVDGSAFLNHVLLVRKARNAEPPATLETDPLVYQGGSSVLLGPRDPIVVPDPAWGCDFEAEVCVVLGDVPQGTTPAAAAAQVRLLLLANDVTYRNLVPAELAKGFGFFQSKPATAFSPVAVTPDELGDSWRDGRLHLRLRTTLNGALAGDPDAGDEMHFSFWQLIAHISRTRAFGAGTILGSGTVSNADRARGVSCLAERRAIETIDHGAPRTPFLAAGDRVHIEMLDAGGRSIFGAIDQTVEST
jgi:fumarylacetoacetate (FAA) hydrolase